VVGTVGWAGLPLGQHVALVERRARRAVLRLLAPLSAQLPLPLDLSPSTMVECKPLRARMPASSCVRQHAAVIPSGRGKGAARFPLCARCGVGAWREALLERVGWRPPPFREFSGSRTNAYRTATYVAWLEGRGPRDELATVDGLPATQAGEMR